MPPGRDGIERRHDRLGAGIGQRPPQMLIEARGIIIKQSADIGIAHRFAHSTDPEPGETRARAERIFGMFRKRRLPGRNGGILVAQSEL